MTEDAPQRDHDQREVFNGLRWIVRTGSPWRYLPHDLPRWYTVYQQMQRWLRAGVLEAIIADLRALVRLGEGKPSNPRRPSLTAARYRDQSRTATGASAEATADGRGIRLEVVKLPEAGKDFVLLPRRWVIERSFAWLSRFRRLTKDDER